MMAAQCGVISRTQALSLGVSRGQINYRLRVGDWVAVYPRVYRAAVVPGTPEQGLRAAALWVENGVLAGVGAAWWWGLLADPPRRWEFQVETTTRRTVQSGICLLRRWVDPYDVVVHREIPILGRPLSVLRAAVALDRARRGHGVRLIDRSKQVDAVSGAQLFEAFERNRGTWGTTTMRSLLERTGDRAHSDLERLGVRLLTEAGIVGFVVNLAIRLANGRTAELDIAFEEQRVAIELDGFRYHSSSEAHAADLRRQNDIIADGWTLLRYAPDVLTESPGRFIREVRRALER
jgi:very-short-patch-repair endonuclease